MSPFSLSVSIIVFIIVVLMVIWIAFPDEVAKVTKRKKKKSPQELEKDWKGVSLKLEKHIYTLREDILKLERDQKLKLREIAVEKIKNTKLQEKLAQQEEWIKKEQGSFGRKDDEIRKFKDGIAKAEKEAEEHYSKKLRIEAELKETKDELARMNKERKDLTGKIAGLEAVVETTRRELEKFKQENSDLKRESEQNTWVAKSEYERLEKKLLEMETELDRVLRENDSEKKSSEG